MIRCTLLLIAIFVATKVILSRKPCWATHGLIGFVVVGSLAAIGTGWEIWPFSPYPMFSNVQQDSYVCSRVYGVVVGSNETEFALRWPYSAPFHQLDLGMAMGRLIYLQNDQRRDAALRECLERYEARRQHGDHDGPALTSLRLYEESWKLDSDPFLARAPPERKLLFEFRK